MMVLYLGGPTGTINALTISRILEVINYLIKRAVIRQGDILHVHVQYFQNTCASKGLF